MWHLAFYIWHLTIDIWHFTVGMWHLTVDSLYVTLYFWHFTFGIWHLAFVIVHNMLTRLAFDLLDLFDIWQLTCLTFLAFDIWHVTCLTACYLMCRHVTFLFVWCVWLVVKFCCGEFGWCVVCFSWVGGNVKDTVLVLARGSCILSIVSICKLFPGTSTSFSNFKIKCVYIVI